MHGEARYAHSLWRRVVAQFSQSSGMTEIEDRERVFGDSHKTGGEGGSLYLGWGGGGGDGQTKDSFN